MISLKLNELMHPQLPMSTVDGQWAWTSRWTGVYNQSLIKVTASMLIGLSNIGEQRLHVFKIFAVFYFWVLWWHKTCIILIDLQTDISNCLGYIIACPQIDLTLPCCSSLPLHTIVTDQFFPKETQKMRACNYFEPRTSVTVWLAMFLK